MCEFKVNDLQGGRLGVFCMSQEKVVFHCHCMMMLIIMMAVRMMMTMENYDDDDDNGGGNGDGSEDDHDEGNDGENDLDQKTAMVDDDSRQKGDLVSHGACMHRR